VRGQLTDVPIRVLAIACVPSSPSVRTHARHARDGTARPLPSGNRSSSSPWSVWTRSLLLVWMDHAKASGLGV